MAALLGSSTTPRTRLFSPTALRRKLSFIPASSGRGGYCAQIARGRIDHTEIFGEFRINAAAQRRERRAANKARLVAKSIANNYHS